MTKHEESLVGRTRITPLSICLNAQLATQASPLNRLFRPLAHHRRNQAPRE